MESERRSVGNLTLTEEWKKGGEHSGRSLLGDALRAWMRGLEAQRTLEGPQAGSVWPGFFRSICLCSKLETVKLQKKKKIDLFIYIFYKYIPWGHGRGSAVSLTRFIGWLRLKIRSIVYSTLQVDSDILIHILGWSCKE